MPGWNHTDAVIESGLHFGGGGHLIAMSDNHGANHTFTDHRPAPRPRTATRRATTTATGYNVCGVALPFDQPFAVDDGRRCVVTRDTDWVNADVIVLKREHSSILGNGTIDEAPSGLYFRGTVNPHFAHDVDNRYELSAAVEVMRTHEIGNGIWHVDVANVHDVSLVRHGRFGHRAIAAVTTPPR